MRRLLRSVIDFDDPKLPADALISNFLQLSEASVEWKSPIDDKLYKAVKEFFDDTGSAPSGQTLIDYFERLNDVEATERLADIKTAPIYKYTNYGHLLAQLTEEVRGLKMQMLLKDTNEIVSKGLTVTEGRDKKQLRGINDALAYFETKVAKLALNPKVGITRGDAARDAAAMLAEYQKAKAGEVCGRFTGFNTIDKTCGGLKPGELWIHAGATGELKTSFAMQWCHNLITRYRANVLYISAEMPYEQLRRTLGVLHSSHTKWPLQGKLPLEYKDVKEGTLSDEDEAHLATVAYDLEQNPEHCQFRVWKPDRDITMADIRMEADRIERDLEIGMIIIDHSLLVRPSEEFKRDDYTTRMNSVIRDAKKLALQFAGGRGVPVLLLHQINREGKKEADKNGGRYGLHCLASANEAERSADYVTTTYLNEEHRANCTTLFSNPKNRDNKPFEPFLASVDWTCRRIFEPFGEEARPRTGSGVMVDDGVDLCSP